MVLVFELGISSLLTATSYEMRSLPISLFPLSFKSSLLPLILANPHPPSFLSHLQWLLLLLHSSDDVHIPPSSHAHIIHTLTLSLLSSNLFSMHTLTKRANTEACRPAMLWSLAGCNHLIFPCSVKSFFSGLFCFYFAFLDLIHELDINLLPLYLLYSIINECICVV